MVSAFRWCLAWLRAHFALIQLVGVLVCISPLLFPAHVPLWTILGSLAGLILLPAVGGLWQGQVFVRTPLDIAVLLLLLLLPFSLLVTVDRALTLPHIYKVIASVALFYSVVDVLNSKPWFNLSAGIICVLAVALAIILLFGIRWTGSKFWWLPVNLSRYIPHLVNPFWKPEGFLGFNANLAGGTLALLLPVPVAYFLFGRGPLVRLGTFIESGIVGLILLFTQSRGALIAMVVAVAAMLVTSKRRWLIVAAILMLGIGLALVLMGQREAEELTWDDDFAKAVQSAEGRSELWSRGLYMMQDFPFTGIGFGMTVEVLPVLYPTFLIPNDGRIEHVHNLYLQAGVDQGFPGLIVLLAFLLGLFYLSWQSARRSNGTPLEPLALGLLGSAVAFATHGLVDTIPYSPKAHLIIWALFGVVVALWLHLARQGRSSGAALASGE